MIRPSAGCGPTQGTATAWDVQSGFVVRDAPQAALLTMRVLGRAKNSGLVLRSTPQACLSKDGRRSFVAHTQPWVCREIGPSISFRPRHAFRVRVSDDHRAIEDRGRREGRELAAPMARLQKEKQAAVTTGSAETSRPSLRDGFTAYSALSPGTGFLAPARVMRWHHRVATTLARCADISTGMSGPRGLTVRSRLFVRAKHHAATRYAHRIPPPRS